MALTSAANVAAMAPNLSASEAVLSALITRAGVALARHCGYPAASPGAAPTLESATYTLFSGGYQVRRKSGRVLVVEPYPVTSITSIHDDPDEEYGSSDLIAASDYVQRGDEGEVIVLKLDAIHGGWSTTDRAVKIVFVAGYSSVPADIETAAIEYVLHLLNLRDRRGVNNVSTPDGLNTSYRDETIPAHVAQLLAPYVLPSGYIP